MDQNDSGRSGSSSERPRTSPAAAEGAGKTSGPTGDRLPPPMFPPGDRRRQVTRSAAPGLNGTEGVPEDAFIMPDEPLRRDDERPSDDPFGPEVWSSAKAAELVDEAFIDPDTPIVRREPPKTPADFERVVRGRTPLKLEDVQVTGIGDDAHLEDDDLVPDDGVERHVRELTRSIERLGDALRLRGEVGLRTTADMTRFEATLRAFCVGYLTRVREEEGS
jgi:hypothetical protein